MRRDLDQLIWLINQLRRYHYDRALCVHLDELPDVDHLAELRKMRLLLTSADITSK